MPENWRAVPAGEVERVIADYNQGMFPASYEQLKVIAQRVGYGVCEVSPCLYSKAYTDHIKHVIAVAIGTTGQMTAQLTHELAELLLRLPVAPEYHFPPTWLDEHHEVAKLVEQSRREIITAQAQAMQQEQEQIETEQRALAERIRQ